MRTRSSSLSSCAILATLLGSAALACSAPADSADSQETVGQSQEELTKKEAVSALRGGLFFTLGVPNTQDNGRACATCHVPQDAFGLTPAHVEERWQALQARREHNKNADDPLFRSIDADDFANDYTKLRTHALVRVVITLPVNAAGQKLVWPVDDPTATTAAVWRGTPSVNNVAFTGPYQLDGRKLTLQEQALGALQAHSETQRDATASRLDDLAAFQSQLFSSPSVRELSIALANGQPPPPTDPVLTPLEQQGKALVTGFCTQTCHVGPTQTKVAPPFADRQNILISRPLPPFVPPALAAKFLPSPLSPPPGTPGPPARLWAFKNPSPAGGPPIVIPSTDPGKALLTGNPNDIGQFDNPAFYGLSKTAPYFHDNSAKTIEEVMQHYVAFFEFLQLPQVIPPNNGPRPPVIQPFMVAPMVAYLKKI